MKRISKEKRFLLIKHQYRIERKRKKKSHSQRPSLKQIRACTKNILRAPEVFSIETQGYRHELLLFLDKLRKQLVLQRKNITIDFSMTKKMVTHGTLLFFAEFHRLLEIVGSQHKVRCIPPRNERVAQVLKQIGILDLMGYTRKINPKFGNVVHWRHACGWQVEGEKYEMVLGDYDGVIANSLLTSLFRGITEAMTNCHHHAYIRNRDDLLEQGEQKRRWWMFSQEREGYLTVVFCDLGIGIPETLPIKKPSLWKKVLSLGKAGSDGYVIQQAVEDSITRTRKAYRGKGLRQLVEVVKDNKGMLRIFSNRGCFTFSDEEGSIKDYADSIMGTLIQWRMEIVQRSLL